MIFNDHDIETMLRQQDALTAAIARNPDNDNVDLASQVDVVKMTWAAWVFIALFTTLALGAWQWLSG